MKEFKRTKTVFVPNSKGSTTLVRHMETGWLALTKREVPMGHIVKMTRRCTYL